MNNDLNFTIKLSTVDILYLKVACTMAKELCNNVTNWDLLREKLNTQYEQCYNHILNMSDL